MPIRPDTLAIGLGERQLAGASAGRDDDVLPRQLNGCALVGNCQLFLPGQDAVTHMDDDLVLLHQVGHALIELLGDAPRPRNNLSHVEPGTRRCQTIGVSVLHIVIDLCRTEQRLGRNTAPVETNAPQRLPLHDRSLEAELRSTDGGNIATGAGAEHNEIIGFAHATSPSGLSTSALNTFIN